MIKKIKKIRTNFRDFLVTFHNPVQNGFPTPESYLEHCQQPLILTRLRYLVFQWEVTPNPEDSENHYQMYFEMGNSTTIKIIQKLFFNGLSVHVDIRKGTQFEAISYCTDKTKKLVLPETFSLGTPRRVYLTTNPCNFDIPETFKEKIIHITEEVRNGVYSSLKDIEKDYPVERWIHESLFQRILSSCKKREEKPSYARVVWIFGESGTGKSIWTQSYLRSLGYQYSEVLEMSYPSMSNSDEHIFFNLDDQFKRVLIVNEADKNFPKKNNLIAWIDRVERLDVKNNQKIDNPFELIVINSIYRPEEVFSYLRKNDAKQVLRRIFNSHSKSSVYHLIPNSEQLKLSNSPDFKMTDREFEEWYKPIVNLISKIDWSYFSHFF